MFDLRFSLIFFVFKNGFSMNQNNLIDIHLPTFRIWICNQRLELSLSNFMACFSSFFFRRHLFTLKSWKFKIGPNLCNFLPYDSGRPYNVIGNYIILLMESNIYNLHIKLSYSSKRPSFCYHLNNRTVEVINDQFASLIPKFVNYRKSQHSQSRIKWNLEIASVTHLWISFNLQFHGSQHIEHMNYKDHLIDFKIEQT